VALPALLDRLGGIATTAELKSHGFSPEIINAFVWSGKVIRICRGWYASPGASATAIAARRAGGRLACVSALQHHGMIVRTSTELHISVERSFSRTRVGDDVVLHWSREWLPGGRLAVSIDAALRQAQRCQAQRWRRVC